MEFEITLFKTEIDYDVAMVTHVIMNREVGNGSTPEQGFNIANTQDESGEVNLIDRSEENAINELVAALGRYLPDAVFESSNDLAFTKVGSFKFLFSAPAAFNTVYVRPLRSAMHEFVVNRVLFDWFIKTKPDEAANYRLLYEESLEKAQGYMNRRTGLVRTKPYPPF